MGILTVARDFIGRMPMPLFGNVAAASSPSGVVDQQPWPGIRTRRTGWRRYILSAQRIAVVEVASSICLAAGMLGRLGRGDARAAAILARPTAFRKETSLASGGDPIPPPP